MKFRNFIIVLLAVLMAFAFASCKNEPKEEPKPTPKPLTGDIYQIEVTEGVDKDYYNRDKIKLVWNQAIKEGDTLSLKYRSERPVYQWDIRNDSHKWVYETDKNGFVDPVLGEDGWYTLEYTFGKTFDGLAGASSAFGVYFRGNFVTTDIFEIKDILLNGEELEVETANIISKAQLNDPAEEFDWTVKNYAVLFATGKPGAVDKTPIAEKVVAGGKVTGAPISKDGFTLTIYTDEAHTAIFDPNEPINEEKIFYYEYVGVPRTVTFVTNSDSVIDPVTVPNSDSLKYAHTYDEAGHYALDGEGNKIIVDLVPENPVKEGYAFAAWCSDEGLTTDFDLTSAITADTTLYAKYGTPRTVTFDAKNGEAEHATQVVADGYAAKMPAEAPTYEEYMFLGWFADEEYTTAYAFGTPVTSDITVYAKWGVPVNVTVNLNYEGAPEAAVFQTPYSVALAETDENLKVEDNRIGYVFTGWATNAEGTTPYNFSAVVTEPITLYAVWKEATLYRLIAVHSDSESLYDYDKIGLKFKDYTYKDAEENEVKVEYRKVSDNDVLSFRYRTTRDFQGFSIRGDKKWIYQNTDAESNYGLTSFEAKEDGWTYVTYKFDSAHGYDTTDEQAADAWFELHFFNRDGSGHLGIVKGDILEIQDFAINGEPMEIDEASVSGYAGATLSIVEGGSYAWTKHAVTFNTGEGSAIDPVEVEYGQKLELPADPTLDGFVFVGWYADAEFAAEFDADTRIIDAITLYAKFGAKKVLTFDSQEGSAVAALNVAQGTPIEEPEAPTRLGYIFDGWYTEAGCENKFSFAAGIEADTTVYAKWVAAKAITLNANGGTVAPAVVYVESGKVLAEPTVQIGKAGFFFGGWYDDAECTVAHDFTAAVSGDATIYAKWTSPAKTYKLTGTAAEDRFQIRLKKSSFSILNNFKAGDVFSYLVKFTPVDGTSTVSRFRVRGASSYGGTSDFSSGITTTDAGDGWIAVTCVFPESANFSENGILMDIRKNAGNFAVGDIIEIKGIAFNGQEIALTSSSSSGPYEGVAPSFAEI